MIYRFTFFKKSIFILLSVLLFHSFVHAQSKIEYTLDDAIKIAQNQSPGALIAKHRFRKSYWEYRSFKAGYLPNVSLSATLPNINRSIVAVPSQTGITSYTAQRLSNYSVNLFARQRIGLTGGEIFLQTGLQRMDNFLPGSAFSQYLSNIVAIGINQPLFSFNPYKWDKRIEPLKYEKAKRVYLESQEDIAINTTWYFFRLLSAQIEKEIAQKNYNNNKKLYNIARRRFNLGKISENDLLQLQLNYLKADASVEKAVLNYNDRLFRFKSYLRIKDTAALTLLPPDKTLFFVIPVDKAVVRAKSATSAGLQFEKRLLDANKEVNRSRLTGRFNMNLSANFGLTQTAGTIPKVYSSPLDQEMVSLGISLPLLDWGQARGRIKMAESNRELVKTSVQQDKIDLEQNVFLKVKEFAMQQKQIYIAAKSDTIAQKNYQITYKRYMLGKISDVLILNNAQINNDNARLSYLNALKDYWLNYYNIRKITLFDFIKNKPLDVDTKTILE